MKLDFCPIEKKKIDSGLSGLSMGFISNKKKYWITKYKKINKKRVISDHFFFFFDNTDPLLWTMY